MNATMQDTLLDLFQQISDVPESIPAVPIDAWPEDSKERQLLTHFRDMLERIQQSRQQAEQQLREREEQYRSVFEATLDGLVINDLEGFCVEANPAYCGMLGYTREELIGLNRSQTTYPEYYPVLEESSQTTRAGGQFQVQGLARRKDGSPLTVEARSTPFIYKGKLHTLG